MDCEPLGALAPDHAPEALQLVALVEVQVIAVALPLVIELGLGLNVTVGAGVVVAAAALLIKEFKCSPWKASAAVTTSPSAQREKRETGAMAGRSRPLWVPTDEFAPEVAAKR